MGGSQFELFGAGAVVRLPAIRTFIKKALEKRKLIKVKMLKSFIKDKNRKEIAGMIADKTNSRVIQQVGFVVVLRTMRGGS